MTRIDRNQSSLIVMPGLTRHPASFGPHPTCRAKATAWKKSVLHLKSGASFTVLRHLDYRRSVTSRPCFSHALHPTRACPCAGANVMNFGGGNRCSDELKSRYISGLFNKLTLRQFGPGARIIPTAAQCRWVNKWVAQRPSFVMMGSRVRVT